MRNLRTIEAITFEAAAGSRIMDCIHEAIRFSKRNGWHDFGENGTLVSFEFNGITVSVKSNSDPRLIYRDWSRALSGYIGGNVGPYPALFLTEEEKENDARIEAKNEQRRQQQQAEYKARATAKKNATDAKLAEAPKMEFSDESAWQQAVDTETYPLSRAILEFAERWARLMQAELANGQKLEDIAGATSVEADTEGITGFMYGAAVSTLASTWKYGDQLCKWHNQKYGVEGIEGTVDPAVIIVFGTNMN